MARRQPRRSRSFAGAAVGPAAAGAQGSSGPGDARGSRRRTGARRRPRRVWRSRGAPRAMAGASGFARRAASCRAGAEPGRWLWTSTASLWPGASGASPRQARRRTKGVEASRCRARERRGGRLERPAAARAALPEPAGLGPGRCSSSTSAVTKSLRGAAGRLVLRASACVREMGVLRAHGNARRGGRARRAAVGSSD